MGGRDQTAIREFEKRTENSREIIPNERNVFPPTVTDAFPIVTVYQFAGNVYLSSPAVEKRERERETIEGGSEAEGEKSIWKRGGGVNETSINIKINLDCHFVGRAAPDAAT